MKTMTVMRPTLVPRGTKERMHESHVATWKAPHGAVDKRHTAAEETLPSQLQKMKTKMQRNNREPVGKTMPIHAILHLP